MDELTARVDALTARVDALAVRVGDLDAEAVGRRYRERPWAYLWRIAQGLEAVSSRELDELLRQAEEAGGLTEPEEEDVRLADAILKGRRKDDGAEVLVVVEAAATLDADDVARFLADQRARLSPATCNLHHPGGGGPRPQTRRGGSVRPPSG